jgi:type IV pilus assembly protein PilM
MAKEMGVWGIDLGQCALKAIRLQEVDGQLTATAFDYVEHPKILSQPDADPDALTREALEKFLSRNTLRGDMVSISVPGQSGLARFVKLPPVEEKKINDIVRFEAKQQIPFNLDEVVWDYQKIGSGIVTDGFAMETEIGLFAMKRDMIGKYLQHFKDVKVEVHVVQMAPLALCNFVAYDLLRKGAPGEEEKGEEGEGEAAAPSKTKNCVVALDIGADSSNLIITDGERIIWQRPIPLGGNHFTRALTKDLKLTFAKAEHLKRNATKSPDLKKILASLKPVLNDFVGEVQRSLGYFTNTHRDAHVEYMVGLGNAFRLPGLQRFLAEKLQLDVRKLAKLERLGGEVLNSPTYTENILGFAVAYGLAVQGLKHARLVTNLLPGEIRIERMVRAKKPWAVTAAACLLFTSGAMALDTYMKFRAFGDPIVIAAENKAAGSAKLVNDAESAFQRAKANADAEEKAVRAIVAGQAERRNWLKITKLLGELTPNPDSSNFRGDQLQKYWTYLDRARADKGGVTGKRAYEEFKRRVDGLAPGSGESGSVSDGDEMGRGLDDLILFNVDTIDSRYAPDLRPVWDGIRKDMQEPRRENMRPMSQWDVPPAGPGWVFELHGHTYHHLGQNFIVDGLVQNIAVIGGAEPPPGTVTASADPSKKADGAAPAAGAAGTPAPAAGTPAPAAGAAGAGKPDAKAEAMPTDMKALEALTKQPFKLSHVVLYKWTSIPVTNFGEVGDRGGVIDSVVKGGSGGGPAAAPAPGAGGDGTPLLRGAISIGGGAGAGVPRPGAGSSPGQWVSLLGSGGPVTGGGAGPTRRAVGGGGRRPGGGARAGRFAVQIEEDDAPAAAAPGPAPLPTTGPAAPAVGQGQHLRTDFTVLFIWQEPTPSDILRQTGAPK